MNLRFYKELLIASLWNMGHSRREAVIQGILMFVNNFIFFTIWYFIFGRFRALGEWQFADVTLLYGITAISYGTCLLFGFGCVDIGRHILDGSLDRHLLQPGHPLLKMVLARSNPSGMGDLLSGFILILGSGRIEWYELWAIPVIAFIGGYLFTSIFILFQCLLFWRERWGAFTDRLNDFVLVFSVYPQNIFDGLFRVMLFTVLPAGYIGFLPVELVRRFNWSQFGLYAVGIVGYGVLAVWMFKAGIKRYQGSQKWTR